MRIRRLLLVIPLLLLAACDGSPASTPTAAPPTLTPLPSTPLPATPLPASATSPLIGSPGEQLDETAVIGLAKAAADQLPSPPRIYERDSSRAQEWPGQAGSLPASLDVCGAMMAAEDNPGCTPPLTLTLSLNSTDGTTLVTFQSDWQSAAGPKSHSWQFSVQRSRRKATFLKEEGDPLPVLPMLVR